MNTTPTTAGDFICAGDLPEADIEAKVATGELTPYRIDFYGREWFRQRCEIRAVPPATADAKPWSRLMKFVTGGRCDA